MHSNARRLEWGKAVPRRRSRRCQATARYDDASRNCQFGYSETWIDGSTSFQRPESRRAFPSTNKYMTGTRFPVENGFNPIRQIPRARRGKVMPIAVCCMRGTSLCTLSIRRYYATCHRIKYPITPIPYPIQQSTGWPAWILFLIPSDRVPQQPKRSDSSAFHPPSVCRREYITRQSFLRLLQLLGDSAARSAS